MSYIATRILLKLLPSFYWNKNGEPKRCTSCSSINLVENVDDSVNGFASEITIRCKKCGSFVQEWAYGYYNTNNMEPEPWWHIAKTWRQK